jgi:photosystem II stability/assembly factor-like uncharacterized protein
LIAGLVGCAACAVVATGPVAGQRPHWVPLNSPAPGSYLEVPLALVADPVHPGVLYAGTRLGGIFKTTDGGDTWAPVNRGLLADLVVLLALDPSNPDRLWAGDREFGEVAFSADGGQTWTDQGTEHYVPDAVDPQDSAILYAIGQRLSASTTFGILASFDGGAHWTQATSATSGITQLAVAPDSAGTLWAVTYQGLLKGVDHGATLVEQGPPELRGGQVASVLIDRHDGSLYVTGYQQGVGRVWRSEDAGESWAAADPALPPGELIERVALAPSRPRTIYATTSSRRLLRSDDGARSWLVAGEQVPGAPGLLVVDGGSPDVLYAIGDRAVFRSRDAGRSWQAVRGLADVPTTVLASRRDPASILALADFVLSRSADGGTTWSALRQDVTLAAADPQDGTLWAVLGERLAQSRDGGATWSRTRPTPSGCSDDALAVAPTSPPTLYILVRPPLYPHCEASPDLYLSTNGGRTWAYVALGRLANLVSVVVDPTRPTTVYAVGGAVFTTTDGGATWRQASRGLPDPLIAGNHPASLAIAVHRGEPILYLALVDGQVFRSADGAGHWQPAAPLAPEGPFVLSAPPALVVDPHEPDVVYGISGHAVLRGRGAFAAWTRVRGVGLAQAMSLSGSLVADAAGELFIGTSDGVFKLVP